MPDAEEDDDEGGRCCGELESGLGIPVQACHPASEGGPETHGLHSPVHPGKAIPIIDRAR
jgi:hypothetical protein